MNLDKKGTHVIKDVVEYGGEIEGLYNFMKRVSDKTIRKKIYEDMMLFKYGLEGEKKVMFELKNSFIPMHIFHNIRLELGDISAQIDIIAITLNFILIIETKQLMGDIEITKDGDFIRYFKTKSGKYYKKEAMYSPFSQAERHANFIQSILRKEGIIDKYPVIPMVVLANPKSIINKSQAPENIVNNICRVDQLVAKLKEMMSTGKTRYDYSFSLFSKVSKYIMENDKPKEFHFNEKYKVKEHELLPDEGIITKDEINEYIELIKKEREMEIRNAREVSMSSLEYTKIEKSMSKETLESVLKKYRMEQARKYNISPAFVFSNKELEEMLRIKPTKASQVSKIPGFGVKKTERHSEDIARIVREYIG